jgi:hypothetical protein
MINVAAVRKTVGGLHVACPVALPHADGGGRRQDGLANTVVMMPNGVRFKTREPRFHNPPATRRSDEKRLA